MHSPALDVAWYRPSGHTVQDTALAADAAWKPHPLHDPAFCPENNPSAHGLGALDPIGQNDPGVHPVHTDCPAMDWYVPAGQIVQDDDAGRVAYVPGLHAMQDDAPPSLKVPGGHATCSTSPVALHM
jgi:hypothetical protein